MGCDQVRELAPELGLDIATGEERDAALRHLTNCSDCRRLVSELSSLSEDLLLLAPQREPPAGFEARVLGALGEQDAPVLPLGKRSRRPRLLLAAALAAAVAASMALGGWSAFLATSSDRRIADSYRQVLSQGQGSFFAAAPVKGSAGRVGTVFGYEGQPSWVIVTMSPSAEKDTYRVEAIVDEGEPLDLGETALGRDERVWATRLPMPLSSVRGLRFRTPAGETLTAMFASSDPWG